MGELRHGESTTTADEAAPTFFGPDPHLALAHADMAAWSAAHPCNCEALCVCDEGAQ